jgi:YihY family inner membrane protein
VGLVDRLDAAQREHRALSFPLAVVYKFVDDQGGYLAALIAYYAFVSLFPLLLLLTTVLSVVLVGHPEVQQQVLSSALGQLPLIGDQLGEPSRLSGGTAGVVIGVVGALYGALGVAQAFQNATNTSWAVPRNSRPNPLAARGRGLLLLGTVGLALLATTVVTAIGGGVGGFGIAGRTVAIVGAVVVNAGAFVLAFRIGTTRPVTVRDVLPGALTAAVLWQLLQSFGALYVGRVVATASATNSIFAVVLGLLAFLYLAAVTVVLCMEVNAVHVDELHPRALLTPFTDDVDLTPGDRRAYRKQAQAQRTKGFERVEVTFDPPPSQHAEEADSGGHRPRGQAPQRQEAP